MKILCKLGIHKWEWVTHSVTTPIMGNFFVRVPVTKIKQINQCSRCGKVRHK